MEVSHAGSSAPENRLDTSLGIYSVNLYVNEICFKPHYITVTL